MNEKQMNLLEQLECCLSSEKDRCPTYCQFYGVPNCCLQIMRSAYNRILGLRQNIKRLRGELQSAKETINDLSEKMPRRGEWKTVPVDNGQITICPFCGKSRGVVRLTNDGIYFCTDDEAQFCSGCGARLSKDGAE